MSNEKASGSANALEQIPIRLVGFGIEHLCGSVRKPAKALIPFPQTDVESALGVQERKRARRAKGCRDGFPVRDDGVNGFAREQTFTHARRTRKQVEMRRRAFPTRGKKFKAFAILRAARGEHAQTNIHGTQ